MKHLIFESPFMDRLQSTVNDCAEEGYVLRFAIPRGDNIVVIMTQANKHYIQPNGEIVEVKP